MSLTLGLAVFKKQNTLTQVLSTQQRNLGHCEQVEQTDFKWSAQSQAGNLLAGFFPQISEIISHFVHTLKALKMDELFIVNNAVIKQTLLVTGCIINE